VTVAEFKVKKVGVGVHNGQWGVYTGQKLWMAYPSKRAATRDANRRNKEQKESK
jgi:hypothetical protein